MKAFPTIQLVVSDNGQVRAVTQLNDGMDLRDYFAAKALQGLMAGRWQTDCHGARHNAYQVDAPEWAKSAYVFADAMMKAREQ